MNPVQVVETVGAVEKLFEVGVEGAGSKFSELAADAWKPGTLGPAGKIAESEAQTSSLIQDFGVVTKSEQLANPSGLQIISDSRTAKYSDAKESQIISDSRTEKFRDPQESPTLAESLTEKTSAGKDSHPISDTRTEKHTDAEVSQIFSDTGAGKFRDPQELPSTAESLVEKQSSFKPWGDRAANEARLTIPERSLVVDSSKALKYEPAVENFPTNNPAFTGAFKDYDDFWINGVQQVPTDVRAYKVPNADVQVIIPERYASAIEAAKASKDPADLALANRLSAEHMPALLEAMPDRSYFKKIVLSDKVNPNDEWVSRSLWWQNQNKAYEGQKFLSTMGQLDEELDTYAMPVEQWIRSEVLHEWSHQLRSKFWHDDLTYRFYDAVQLERGKWNIKPYADRNEGEQWAVHGEAMLGNSGADFIDTAQKAPLRMVCFMKALGQCLESAPEAARSIDHDTYVERVKYVEDNILPLAIKKAQSILDDPTWFDHAKVRARWLLDFMKNKTPMTSGKIIEEQREAHTAVIEGVSDNANPPLTEATTPTTEATTPPTDATPAPETLTPSR